VRNLNQRGYYVGIATGKGRRGLDRALKEHNCEGLFHISRCADETFSKPHPRMLLEIMEELDVSPKETLMIGDTSTTYKWHVTPVWRGGVSYGVHGRERLLQHAPLACVDSIAELEIVIKDFSKD